MKQIYRVDKSGNLAQAISEITAPKLLLLMSNNEQFEQHVEELERHFPGVPSIGCIGGSYGGQTVVADNGVAVIAMEGNLSVVTNVLEQASTMPVKYIGRLEEDINKVADHRIIQYVLTFVQVMMRVCLLQSTVFLERSIYHL